MIANFDSVFAPNQPDPTTGGTGSITTTPPPDAGSASASGSAYALLRSGGTNFALGILQATVPLTAERKTLSARVFSPTAGIPIKLKLEVAGMQNVNTGDVAANEPVVMGWQTLTWTFTSANPSNTYGVLVLLPNIGTIDQPPGKTYFFDDIKLLAAKTSSRASSLPVTFDDPAVTYALTGFEGAEDSTVVVDPMNGANKVVKVVKRAGAPWFAGTIVSTGPNNTIATIPFTANAKTMTLRVLSPGPGMLVRVKVENASNGAVSSETDAATVGTGWETLTFNFANPGVAPPVTGGPTPALNVAETYNKAVVFMNVAPAQVGLAGTFFFDNLAFGTP